jgi:hypothetical protein
MENGIKERLTAVFNLLKAVETKGDSTVFMADCLRELANIINTMSEESEPDKCE